MLLFSLVTVFVCVLKCQDRRSDKPGNLYLLGREANICILHASITDHIQLP